MEGIIPSIPVADINRAVEFYQQVLGFELVRITGKDEVTRAFLRAGNVRLILRSSTKEAQVDYRQIDLSDRLMLHVPVREAQGFFERIRDRVRVVREPVPKLFGVFEFTVEDTEGILLTFSELPS